MRSAPRHPYRPSRATEHTPHVQTAQRSVWVDLLRALLLMLLAVGLVRLVIAIDAAEPLEAVRHMHR